jgi:hypothetical protein
LFPASFVLKNKHFHPLPGVLKMPLTCSYSFDWGNSRKKAVRQNDLFSAFSVFACALPRAIALNRSPVFELSQAVKRLPLNHGAAILLKPT